MDAREVQRVSVDQGSWPENIGTVFRKRVTKMDTVIACYGDSHCEYFCCWCRQLRLYTKGVPTGCGCCGSKDIITGPPGTLDKDALIRELDGLTE